ncbi:MAG: MBOAT family protein [Clostridia bacterium]|nr:MBOAT family protein [Clostridia bacterium]
MSLVSIEFIGFVIISLLLYYMIPKKYQWIMLLVSSISFYLIGGTTAILYLIFTTLTTYFAGRLLGKCNKEDKKYADIIKKKKRLIVLVTALLNFGILFFLKYWNPVADMINNTLQVEKISRLELILPLGLSFYIFQSIGYIIDVYRNKYDPERNVFKYTLFTSFFPQMVQGPISRFDSLGNELFSEHKFSWDNLKDGIQLLMLGYFKKLVIADRAAVVVNAAIGNYTEQSGSVLLVAMILYCIQLYCDFSGGIDVTRAVAKMFGITLVDNFKRPIFSTSLTDFWRRWHISLGSWMKDYLFFPMSMSKPFVKFGKFVRKHIPGKAGKILPVSMVTFIVYFVIGIWHGGSLKYIAFGFWNGILITTALLLEPFFIKVKQKLNITDKNKLFYIFQIVRTSIIVLIGRYITRAPRLLAVFDMARITFTNFNLSNVFDGTMMNFGITVTDYIVIIVGTMIMLIMEAIDEYGVGTKKILEKKKVIIQWILLMISILTITVFGICRGNYIASEFIYKQF